MKQLIMMVCLVGGLSHAILAEEPGSREDTATYRLTELDQPATAAAGLVAHTQNPAEIMIAAPLAELRARHLADYQALERAILAASGQATIESLERQARDLKLTQAREELAWLKADALTRQDQAYAARLDEAMRALEPGTAPVATTFVPRDPSTGRSLNGIEEGGSK